jgi:hypothetical protein
MRIGVMVVLMSLSTLAPGSLLADPDIAAPASEPAASAQAATVASDQQAGPAATAAQSAPVAQASSPQNPEEVVCKSSMMITGSRLGAARECHSASWWSKHEQPAAQQQPKTEADSGH